MESMHFFFFSKLIICFDEIPGEVAKQTHTCARTHTPIHTQSETYTQRHTQAQSTFEISNKKECVCLFVCCACVWKRLKGITSSLEWLTSCLNDSASPAHTLVLQQSVSIVTSLSVPKHVLVCVGFRMCGCLFITCARPVRL